MCRVMCFASSSILHVSWSVDKIPSLVIYTKMCGKTCIWLIKFSARFCVYKLPMVVTTAIRTLGIIELLLLHICFCYN